MPVEQSRPPPKRRPSADTLVALGAGARTPTVELVLAAVQPDRLLQGLILQAAGLDPKTRQQLAIDKAEANLRQGALCDIKDKDQKRQVDLDLKHIERQRTEGRDELVSEPAAIEALYEVNMSRLTAVGLVVAWPESMT